MNIFFLSHDPHEAAIMQCDKHVVKMIVESAQLLSTAHWCLDGTPKVNGLYKVTHRNHPSAVWARTNSMNYEWLFEHFLSLCGEYTYRYGRQHKTYNDLTEALSNLPTRIRISEECSPVPLCMPVEYKVESLIESYRSYYRSKQNSFRMTWTKRQKPDWFL